MATKYETWSYLRPYLMAGFPYGPENALCRGGIRTICHTLFTQYFHNVSVRYNVIQYSNGKQTLERFTEMSVDVVLSVCCIQ